MTRSMTLCLVAALPLGCATNYVGDVPQDDTGGESSGANDGHSGGNPGDDGLSGNVFDEGSSGEDDEGEGESCIEIGEICGDEPQLLFRTTIDAYRTPDLGFEPNGSVTDTACTIASSAWNEDAVRTVLELDCADEVHWQLWVSLPHEALANLWVGRELDLAYAWEEFDYQRNLALLAGPGDPIFLAQNGRHVAPAGASYDPFTVEVLTGVCQPYCIPDDQCVTSELQTLRFGYQDESVDVWGGNSASVGTDRTYGIFVDWANDNPVVHPDLPQCEAVQSIAQYWFVIAETTPVE